MNGKAHALSHFYYYQHSMFLIISRPRDAHVDYMLPQLQATGHFVHRLFLEQLPDEKHIELSIEQGDFSGVISSGIDGFGLEKIKSAWVRPAGDFVVSQAIANEQHKAFVARESRVVLESLYSILNCRWVNHPACTSLADNKIYQLTMAQKLGFRIPRSVVTQDPDKAKAFFYSCKERMIVKPFKSFSFRNDDGSLVAIPTHLVTTNDLAQLSWINVCPTLLQEYIEKDVELRITVVDDKVFACAIHSQEHELTQVDWRLGVNSESLRYSKYTLPDSVSEFCVSLNRSLGLSFSAIDMIKTPKGEYVFLEVNPNGQWLWIEQKLGLPISSALIALLSQDD